VGAGITDPSSINGRQWRLFCEETKISGDRLGPATVEEVFKEVNDRVMNSKKEAAKLAAMNGGGESEEFVPTAEREATERGLAFPDFLQAIMRMAIRTYRKYPSLSLARVLHEVVVPNANQIADDHFFDDVYARSTTPAVMAKHRTQLCKYHFIFRDPRSKLVMLRSWYELVKEHSLIGNSTGMSMSLSLALFVSVIKNSPHISGLSEDQFCELIARCAVDIFIDKSMLGLIERIKGKKTPLEMLEERIARWRSATGEEHDNTEEAVEEHERAMSVLRAFSHRRLKQMEEEASVASEQSDSDTGGLSARARACARLAVVAARGTTLRHTPHLASTSAEQLRGLNIPSYVFDNCMTQMMRLMDEGVPDSSNHNREMVKRRMAVLTKDGQAISRARLEAVGFSGSFRGMADGGVAAALALRSPTSMRSKRSSAVSSSTDV